MMKRKLCFAAFMMASGLLSAAAPLVRFDGALTDKLPGWKFKASNPKNGMTYNPFEGYYPDKGGKLSSNRIRLDKKPGESAYYRIRFDARAPERAYQGVDFFDAAGNLLPDCYDVVYPGEKQSYDRVVYAMPSVDSMEVFFQSTRGVEAWNLRVERVDAAEGAAYCDRVYSTLPRLDFKAPADAMKLLPKTRAAMENGTPWNVVLLGDSIMQDTFHSQFHALFKREFPNSNFTWNISMRGGTGCWLYCQADQFKHYVLDRKPDLLIIGGISNYNRKYSPTGTEAMEIVVRAAKEYLNCEVLLLSAALSVDTRPRDAKNPSAPIPKQNWSYDRDAHLQRCWDRTGLAAMAKRNQVACWDMSTPTYSWLWSSGQPFEFFSRDNVHSGEKGKQVIGRTLLEYFKAK